MAEKRMFSRELVESDQFLELPLSAQGLYMHICMEADDDGFVNNANRIRKVVEASQEDYRTLFDRGYLLQMANGLVVVAHWKICNSIRKDRYKPTVHQSEYKKLKVCDNVYTLSSESGKSAMAEQEYAKLIVQGIKEEMLIASAKAYARAKDGQDPKYLNCPDSWLQKCIYSDYEVKEEKPKGPQQPEEEPGIDMWNGEDEPKNGETV